MKQEVFTLTQQAHSPYAGERVIFMAETDNTQAAKEAEARVEQERTEEQQTKESAPEAGRKLTPQEKLVKWQKKFEARIQEITQAELPDKYSPEELSEILKKMDGDIRRELFEELAKIDVDESVFQSNPALAGMRRQLRDLLAQQEAAGNSEVLSQPAAFNEQLITQFGKFMGRENVRIEYAVQDDVTVDRAADGFQVVKVPKNPSIQTLIQIAQRLHPEQFTVEAQTSMRQFAQDLQKAALLMDDAAIFSPDAIKALYNTGAQLEHIIDAPTDTHLPVYELPEIQKESRTIIETVLPEDRNRIFLEVVMGKHQLQPDTPRESMNIYDVYFQRWESQLARSQDPDEQELFAQWDGMTLDDKQRLYDQHLREKKIQDGITRFLRPTIEKALRPGGKAVELTVQATQRKAEQDIFQGTIDRWRNIVGEDLRKRAPEIAERLHALEYFAQSGFSPTVEVLRDITEEFQPDKKAEFLDYLPKNLVDKMSEENRDAAACIVAAAYEKIVLEEALKNEDGTSDYLVIPELINNHATLLVVEVEGNRIYRVDPSAPKGEEDAVHILDSTDPIYQEVYNDINTKFPEDAIEDFLFDPNIPGFEVYAQRQDADGKTHTVMSGDRLFTSTLLSNMAILDKYLEGEVPTDKVEVVRLAAAEEAVRLAPENPIAQELMRRLQARQPLTELAQEAEAKSQEEKKEPEAPKKEDNLQDLLVGDWKPGTGWLAGPGRQYRGGNTPTEFDPIINTVEAAVGGNGLEVLSDQMLENTYDDFVREYQAYRTTRPELVDFAMARINDLRNEINRRNPGGGNEISVFNLTRNEIKRFAGNDAAEQKKSIEDLLKFFGKVVKPGRQIPVNEAQITQEKFNDILKILNANPNKQSNPAVESARKLALKYSKMIVGPVQIAAALESGDPKQVVEQAHRANSMDDEEGHDTYGFLKELHEGRSGYLADRMWSVMNRWRLENTRFTCDDKGKLKEVSEPIITPSQYEELQEKVVEEQVHEALKGRGRYKEVYETVVTKEVTEDFIATWKANHGGAGPAPADITAYLNDPNTGKEALKKKLQDEITIDANFGHLTFIIDGRASAVGILGLDPNTFEPSQGKFIDGQMGDVQRYAMFPSKGREFIFEKVTGRRIETYIRLRFGEDVLNMVKKNKNGFERFRKQLGWELLAPSVKRRYENSFLYTRTDMYDLKKWYQQWQDQPNQRIYADQGYFGELDATDPGGLHSQDARIRQAAEAVLDANLKKIRKSIEKGTQFGLFSRVLLADKTIKSPGEFDTDPTHFYHNPDDMDPVVMYIMRTGVAGREDYIDPDRYKRLKDVNKDNEKEAYVKKCVQYGLLKETVAPFYPEKIMEAFALEPDFWTDPGGNKFDPRFVNFFSSDVAAFLDSIPGAQADAEKKIKKILGKHFDELNKSREGRETINAQVRFQIFQDRIAPVIASIRSMNMNGIDPNLDPAIRAQIEQLPPGGTITVNGRPVGRKLPKQTNFRTEEYTDFITVRGVDAHGNPLDRDFHKKVQALMAAMTVKVTATDTDGYKDYFGLAKHGWEKKNSLIGRLAFDPLMERVLFKSPLSTEDIPYWMLHGEDPYGKMHPSDKVKLSGIGRWMGSSQASTEIRSAAVDIIRKGNLAQLEESMLKPWAEKITANIGDMNSPAEAKEDELSFVTAILGMMQAKGLEMIGAENLPLFKNSSEARKYFGRTLRAFSEEQIKSLYQSQYAATMIKPEYRALFEEYAFDKKWRRNNRRFWKIVIAILLMTMQQSLTTGMETFAGEIKG